MILTPSSPLISTSWVKVISASIRFSAEKSEVRVLRVRYPDLFAFILTDLSRIKVTVSPEMALRLSEALGRTAESWLAMQGNYDR
ncbi:helix-turn-helix transcriptional regulator [Oceanospirillum sediminis]|uniref:helix-turn-helix transcriptional regulator n=1 Tax=Oceanospirillum sediminis TaxID=2760088 RepID=UPI001C728FB8|nr:hypothetical protein [Oceanospirillum sediminis]